MDCGGEYHNGVISNKVEPGIDGTPILPDQCGLTFKVVSVDRFSCIELLFFAGNCGLST